MKEEKDYTKTNTSGSRIKVCCLGRHIWEEWENSPRMQQIKRIQKITSDLEREIERIRIENGLSKNEGASPQNDGVPPKRSEDLIEFE
jgi:hypothetical protein